MNLHGFARGIPQVLGENGLERRIPLQNATLCTVFGIQDGVDLGIAIPPRRTILWKCAVDDVGDFVFLGELGGQETSGTHQDLGMHSNGGILVPSLGIPPNRSEIMIDLFADRVHYLSQSHYTKTPKSVLKTYAMAQATAPKIPEPVHDGTPPDV